MLLYIFEHAWGDVLPLVGNWGSDTRHCPWQRRRKPLNVSGVLQSQACGDSLTAEGLSHGYRVVVHTLLAKC